VSDRSGLRRSRISGAALARSPAQTTATHLRALALHRIRDTAKVKLIRTIRLDPSDTFVFESAALVETLANTLRQRFGAPDRGSALAAAEEEVAFAASLCDHPVDTLIAVRRTFEDGGIREAFRTLQPRGARKPMRAFSFIEVQGELEVQGEEEGPGDDVNLVRLAKEKPRSET
jgi:hypothetical protein